MNGRRIFWNKVAGKLWAAIVDLVMQMLMLADTPTELCVTLVFQFLYFFRSGMKPLRRFLSECMLQHNQSNSTVKVQYNPMQ